MKCWKLFILCFAVAFAFTCPAGAADLSDGVIVVQQGQTLRAIAAQHKVSVEQIIQWNKLSSPDKIRVGQKLYIRPPDHASASAPARTAPPPPRSPAQSSKQAKKTAPEPPNLERVTAPDDVPEKVNLELAKACRTLVGNAAKTIVPNIKSKAVVPDDSGGFVARYVEVDTETVRMEVIPSAKAGNYVGSIRYVEYRYECPGKSKNDALQAECRMVGHRRINELIRYEKGKWHY